jgi:phosphodiesterase/alkaline phosphatase D-like protein
LFADCTLYHLKPSKRYCYVIGNDFGWTIERSFTTAPPLYSKPHKTTFAVFGDMGIDNSNGTLRLLNEMINNGELDVVLHVGDIAYAGLHSHT